MTKNTDSPTSPEDTGEELIEFDIVQDVMPATPVGPHDRRETLMRQMRSDTTPYTPFARASVNPLESREEYPPLPPPSPTYEELAAAASTTKTKGKGSSAKSTDSKKPQAKANPPTSGGTSTSVKQPAVRVNGQVIPVRTSPNLKVGLGAQRMWKKEERTKLSKETWQIFNKSAMGYSVLRNNKLTVQSLTTDTNGKLEHVFHLSGQLKSIQEHLIMHDLMDTFHIVMPQDANAGPQLASHSYNLFTDYIKLDPSFVAQSNKWYNYWASQDWIQDDLVVTYQFLKFNTEESLWTKCLEEYEEYPAPSQGGPLILSLILRRIQNASETAMINLRDQLAHLNIKKIPGEDIEVVVSFIKSTQKTLQSASTADHSFISTDFPLTVLKALQTSSVPDFNETFKDLMKSARKEADARGGQPIWPAVQQITNIASAQYLRLRNSGDWNVPSKTGSSSFISSTEMTCWNCGRKGHSLKECRDPLDQKKIDANKKKFLSNRSKNKGNSSPSDNDGQPVGHRRLGEGGKPLIKNKKGAYVADTKRLSEWKRDDDEKTEQRLESLVSYISDATNSTAPSSRNTSPQKDDDEVSSGSTLPTSASLASREHRARAKDALRQLMQSDNSKKKKTNGKH